MGFTPTVNLNGSLNADLNFGAAPAVGTTYTFLTAAQVNGTFSNTSIPSGTTVHYTSTTASLPVTNAVPAILATDILEQTNVALNFYTATNESDTVQFTTNLPPVWQP